MRRVAPAGGARAAVLAAVLAGCAGAGASSGPPLANPAEVAASAREAGGPDAPHRLEIAWEYTDERGPVSGDGVVRYNPTDSLRLDLFGPGGGSMSVALTGTRLRSRGQIRDVRVPPPPFLYASAGIFRPGPTPPERGYRLGEAEVLVYSVEEGGELRFHLADDRLLRVEEVRDGRVVREAVLEWADGASAWPASAEYRDRAEGSRARWTVEEVRVADGRFPPDIYDLPLRGTP